MPAHCQRGAVSLLGDKTLFPIITAFASRGAAGH